MKKLICVAFSLLGLVAPLVSGHLAFAAEPTQGPPGTDLRSGPIEFLNLDRGVIVVEDHEFRISDKVTINGKSGSARYSLRSGMRIKFSTASINGAPTINEIWIEK